jgi:hypothetical protein
MSLPVVFLSGAGKSYFGFNCGYKITSRIAFLAGSIT